MRPILLLSTLVITLSIANAQSQARLERIKVSADNRYLQYDNGQPFFWLGDTGWELFHRLTLEEIDQYLTNRQAKGFTVINAVILAETDGLNTPNQYGDLPLINRNPNRPNEAYFELVDKVLKMASERDLYVALLPTWGDKVAKLWGKGPEIFNTQNAYNYGLYLGKRYKSYTNIIWTLGGDRPGVFAKTDYRPIWRAMAKGILEGTGELAILTYHPNAGNNATTKHLNNETWLSINMFQSGHGYGHDVPIWDWIKRDRAFLPTRPTLDGEINYEDHPVSPWPKWDPDNGYYSDYDVRKQCYRSVFAGACGVTYGHHAVWQFYSPNVKPINHVNMYWTEALDRPGAYQAGYLLKLMESRPMQNREPDNTFILSGQGTGGQYIQALRDADKSYAFIYLPVGKTIKVNTGILSGNQLTGWWYNPKNAAAIRIGTWSKQTSRSFTPPTLGRGNDWVLVLDNTSFQYPAPGVKCDCVPL